MSQAPLTAGRRLDVHVVCGVALVAVGWGLMTQQTLAMTRLGALAGAGPGMGLIDWIRLHVFGDIFALETIRSLCVAPDGPWLAGDFLKAFAMWFAMVLAMMLPRYLVRWEALHAFWPAERLAYLAGYLAAWGLFCIVAVAVQWGLSRAGHLSPFMIIENNGLSAGLSVVLALICVFRPPATQDRSGFLRRNASGPRPAFGLGLVSGRDCVKSCWAPMGLPFVLGLMNLVAMAGLTLAMILTATGLARHSYRAMGLVAALVAASALLGAG